MQTALGWTDALAYFLKDETGRSKLEDTLIIALAIVVCALAVLAAHQVP